MDKITAILDAAEYLFSKKGYEHTPVAEVADMAGVAAGTIIYHFKNKENLLFIVTWRILNRLYKHCLGKFPEAGPGMSAMQELIAAFFSFLRENTSEYKVLLKNTILDTLDVDTFPNADLKIIHNRFLQLFKDAIGRGIEDGSMQPDLPVHDSAMMVYAMLAGSARLYIYYDEPLDRLEAESKNFAGSRLAGRA